MKKVMFVMAVAGMFAFAACNNNNTEEVAMDSVAPVEEVVEEVANDSAVAAEDAAVEATDANVEAAQ